MVFGISAGGAEPADPATHTTPNISPAIFAAVMAPLQYFTI
jgi:hypothetical protein